MRTRGSCEGGGSVCALPSRLHGEGSVCVGGGGGGEGGAGVPCVVLGRVGREGGGAVCRVAGCTSLLTAAGGYITVSLKSGTTCTEWLSLLTMDSLRLPSFFFFFFFLDGEGGGGCGGCFCFVCYPCR